MPNSSFSRRDFLKLIRDGSLTLSGILGLIGLIRFFSYEAEPPQPTEFDLGSVDNFLPGSRTLFLEIPAVLIRNDSGFNALSLVCTHLGCTVNMQMDGTFSCPCHGSKFNNEGHVVQGPANKPLNILQLEVTPENKIILHTQ